MLVAYQIGHEALRGKGGVPGIKSALKEQPSCAAEILIAGITETLETQPPETAVFEALKMLHAAARTIDGETSAPRKPRGVSVAEKKALHASGVSAVATK